ncbi:hypothetical protein CYG48_11030 [Neorhizobium sp. SOG26]|nr:hypothetical protein CYG48_11030 [Neorhizobium sp. SOG26]
MSPRIFFFALAFWLRRNNRELPVSNADLNQAQAETALLQEVKNLRAEVARLSARLETLDHAAPAAPPEDPHPWIKIAATVGITFAIGKIIQMLRLPTATTAAIPLITNQVNKHIF